MFGRGQSYDLIKLLVAVPISQFHTMKELSESKTSSSTTSSPSNRAKASRVREIPRLESANRVSTQTTGRPKPISLESLANPKVKRSILPNKLRLDGENVTYKREMEAGDPKIGYRPGVPPVEKYAQFRRKLDINSSRCEDKHDDKATDLQKRLDANEILVKDMQLEISCLKEEIEKLKGLNVELEEQKKKLANDLLAAEIKFAALNRHDQGASAGKERVPSELDGVQKHTANKLDQIVGEKTVDEESINNKMQYLPLNRGAKPEEVKSNILINKPLKSPPELKTPPPPPHPPPPPPPPHLHSKKEGKMQNATALVEFYHCLTKRDAKGNGNCSSQVASSVHNSLVGELQNRSAHLLAM
ncbi:uncharacterized protein DDB_G0284459 isoform X2 [Dendrobium catenatum]|uniref:uncharacterized protein DDB_G0284459 isoform X2 n=1 Tax=Dendrobium catenatum TaxID=906689 RepID=UPI00109F49D8|nr:uncharacterized protein DDB_G0284459 isoform X2 [Dendrobium catenatum]